MPQLTPSQAAKLADSAYLLENEELEFVAPADLNLPPNFAVDSKFSGRTGLGVGSLTGFGFVAGGNCDATRNEMIVAIRGTDPTLVGDIFTDALIGFGVPGPTGSTVHTGFSRTWRSLQNQIDRRLPPNSLVGTSVHCIGHSLGGALATLAADHLSARGAHVKLYTFGCPRVGMIDFTTALTKRVGADNMFRVYHPADPVPMMPVFPFTHAPAGQIGYALACGSNERFRGEAHKMKTSYIPGVSNMSYAALARNGAQTLSDRQIESWLKKVKAGGWIQNYGARAMEMIGIALDWVLRKILEGAMIGLQPYLAAGVSLMDALAYVLHIGARLVKDVSWYIEAIMLAILKFVGRTVTQGVSLSIQFIRWALEKMLRELAAMARGIVNQR
ncbi:MAG TPA: lipase family protein [Casimicrobium sp.]|jgi:pimeloyl-ACP methyl ester carboxylesterase|nr:lipase family protein [Casimicrobium sp.]